MGVCRHAVCPALLGIALIVACDPREPTDGDDGPLAGVEIDLLEALEIAADHEPDGITLDAELTDEYDDGPVYDVDRHVGGETRELSIDAGTGEVRRVHIDPDDQAEGVEEAEVLESSAQMITLADAIETAVSAEDGDPVSAELDVDRRVIQVVMLLDDGSVAVAIDLDDGSVVSIGDAPPSED